MSIAHKNKKNPKTVFICCHSSPERRLMPIPALSNGGVKDVEEKKMGICIYI